MAVAAKGKRAAAVKGRTADKIDVASMTVDGPLDLGVLNDLLGFRFRRIQNHLAKAFMDDARHGDLKAGMFSIMALIAANPGLSQGQLAQEAGIDRTALVFMLDDLEESGLAVRVRAKSDRRKHALHVTDKGAKALQSLTEAAHFAEAPARASLSAKEISQLLAILDKLSFREHEL
jgi:DNA-binding MarR family transcriptional regulator